MLDTFHQAFGRTHQMVGPCDDEPFSRKKHGFVVRQSLQAKPPPQDGTGRTLFSNVLALGVQNGCVCSCHRLLLLCEKHYAQAAVRERSGHSAWSLSVEGFSKSGTPVGLVASRARRSSLPQGRLVSRELVIR